MSRARAILPTKVQPPRLRARQVGRPRLRHALDGMMEHGLITVVGPAGAGKSTALAQWVAQVDADVGWVSVEVSDDHPAAFAAYLIAALGRALGEGGGDADAILRAPEPPELEALLADRIVIPLAERERPLVLVLDDYHLIGDVRIHRAMIWLVEHRPPCLRIVVISRVEPPLSLSRMRARDQVGELDAMTLRFSAQEAREFYAEVMALTLDEAQLRALEAQTEGWPAGAQLVALSLGKGRRAADDALGRDRLVADYLLTEVLEGLCPGRQDFVVTTSVLGRMCEGLCDAVTGRADAREHLHGLERDNLFLVPLPGDGDTTEWFRYHHLFRDFLRRRVARRGSAQVAAIHRRASQWYAEHELRAEAIDHARAAEDHGGQVALIERWGLDTLLHNQVGQLQSWLASVPEPVARVRAAVPFFSGWCDIIVGHLGRGVARLHQAQQQLDRDAEADPITRLVIAGGVPMLEAHARIRGGELEAGRQIAERTIATLTPEAGSLLGALLLARGLVALRQQRLPDAMAAFVEAEPLLHGEHDNAVICVAYQAQVYRTQRRWDEAEAAARRALGIAEAAGASERSPAGYAGVELAWVALCRGELDVALGGVEQGLARMVLLRDVAYIAHGTELLARVHEARGQPVEALGAVDDALALLEGTDMKPDLARMRALRGPLVARSERAPAASARSVAPSVVPPVVPPVESLTERELDVLREAARGLSNREIAKALFVSTGTIKTHMHRILRKLDVDNRTRAVHRARLIGLL